MVNQNLKLLLEKRTQFSGHSSHTALVIVHSTVAEYFN